VDEATIAFRTISEKSASRIPTAQTQKTGHINEEPYIHTYIHTHEYFDTMASSVYYLKVLARNPMLKYFKSSEKKATTLHTYIHTYIHIHTVHTYTLSLPALGRGK